MGNSQSSIEKSKKVYFTIEEANKEANVIIWLQNLLLDLQEDNIFVAVETILESYDLEAYTRLQQFLFNLILAYRIRPKKSEVYAKFIFHLCDQLKDPTSLKEYLVKYMTSTYNMNEPLIIATPYLSLLYHCYKMNIITSKEICNRISYVKHLYSEFIQYLCLLLYWFAPELLIEDEKLFKSLLKIFEKEKNNWIFPEYLAKKLFLLNLLKNNRDNSQKDSVNNEEIENKMNEVSNNDFYNEFRKNGFEPNSIFDAIRRDDISALKEFGSNPLFNIEEIMESSPFVPYPILQYKPRLIHIAAFFNSIKCFKYLLLNEADIESSDEAGYTTIHFAVAGGSVEIIRILEQQQFIIFNGTPQVAAQFHQKEILEWLTEEKFNNISEYDQKYGALSFNAAISNNVGLLLYLEENNVDLDTPNPSGSSPLHFACSYGCFDAVYFLLSRPKINSSRIDNNHDTALHIATYFGCVGTARLLDSVNSKLATIKNGNNYASVQAAAIFGHDQILYTLIKHKNIDINCATKGNCTLLHLAVINGHFASTKIILSRPGVFISPKDNDGNTPLHYAARKNFYNCARILLKQDGINVNAYNYQHVFTFYFSNTLNRCIKIFVRENNKIIFETSAY
ncbi:hypothetical protein TRFO_04852 [Tritrichomonas foetus]|uniref:Uncharacterized protein n=1 Tax=Tritrichomonas foetus TaxID=1144522 RepID=A0A1J4KG43_9EUKA|nr:hypothetical protein TRFO_04852 [Tritrichomonas foetus]|eukprot:OHT08740.1 hypothetical protein TRFO_04852 [Tritrichomonas foetus]